MKKFFITSLLLSISFLFQNIGFADDCSQSCKITEAPAPALTEYFTNMDTLIDNIVSALNEAESKPEASKRNERMKVLGSLNATLSFGNHFGEFDCKVGLLVTNEIPAPVRRDLDHIESYSEKLTAMLERYEKRGSANTNVKDLCNGIANCNITADTARFFMIDMINNNNTIKQLYCSSIQDKSHLVSEKQGFFLVSGDFRSQIETYYNKDTLSTCSACKGGFKDKISEKIKTISGFTSGAKEGIQAWKDAMKLIRGGSKSPGYAEQEEVLLNQYLAEQGVESSQAGVIMGNLNRYNSGGLSSSNPLFNSARNAQVQVQNETDTFQETLQEKLAGKEKVPYIEVVRVKKELQGTKDISQSIASIYEEQLPFSQTQDVGAQQLQARIIKMHFDIVESINILGGQVSQAEKLCDKQGTGLGKCTFQ